MSSLLSKLTVGTIGLSCKAFLNIGYCASVKVTGLDTLLEALHNDERNKGRGVITICNHLSTLDDPLTWGILPAHYYFNTHTTRWSLGAHDIIFTNPVFSAFFRNGQVLETFRGQGVFQPAVDTAIRKLNQGAWIHLFGEGKVNQPGNPLAPAGAENIPLLRFKWGVGRIIMEAVKPPIIIPMWLTGFDKLMPEGRPPPFKFLPKPDVHLSITFGEPINTDDIKAALGPALTELPTDNGPQPLEMSDEAQSLVTSARGWLHDAVENIPGKVGSGETWVWRSAKELARVRSAVTAVLYQEVDTLGRKVMGGAERM